MFTRRSSAFTLVELTAYLALSVSLLLLISALEMWARKTTRQHTLRQELLHQAVQTTDFLEKLILSSKGVQILSKRKIRLNFQPLSGPSYRMEIFHKDHSLYVQKIPSQAGEASKPRLISAQVRSVEFQYRSSLLHLSLHFYASSQGQQRNLQLERQIYLASATNQRR
ncbi:MAG: hypothetical protein D6805_06970 [Planctomycetota bacterium]|nr:MAG: hypothetical protein D6805_06970 [Planctomycetota bacterium]